MVGSTGCGKHIDHLAFWNLLLLGPFPEERSSPEVPERKGVRTGRNGGGRVDGCYQSDLFHEEWRDDGRLAPEDKAPESKSQI